MSITFDQVILDAQRIANRVKDLEALGNAVLVEAKGNNKQIESMKQFYDDMDSLNKLARNKTNAEMINCVNRQNPSLREFRQENRELKATIEDHQRALEIIMHKYREQINHKIFNSRINFKEHLNSELQNIIFRQQKKINEMTCIMQKAASIDDDIINNEIETISRLKIENQGLRELLQISKQFGTPSLKLSSGIDSEEKCIQTETIELLLLMLNSENNIDVENNSGVINKNVVLKELLAKLDKDEIIENLLSSFVTNKTQKLSLNEANSETDQLTDNNLIISNDNKNSESATVTTTNKQKCSVDNVNETPQLEPLLPVITDDNITKIDGFDESAIQNQVL